MRAVAISLLLLFAVSFSRILVAGDAIVILDKGTDGYWRLMLARADDPERAKEQALAILQDSAAKRDAWLQSFVFLLNNAPEKLSAADLNNDSLKAKITEAEQLDLKTISLELQFFVRQEEIKMQKGGSSETFKLLDDFIERAEAQKCLRFLVAKTLAKGFLFYGIGDMKQALLFARESMDLLHGKVPLDDLQLLVVKANIADFLDYTTDHETAEQILKEIIETYQKNKWRNSLAEANFSYGFMLSQNRKFRESEQAYRIVEGIAKDLRSNYLLGHALRGLGYVQTYTDRPKEAIESNLKALPLLEGPQRDPIAIADTYKILAIAYSKEKKWADMLKSLNVAEQEPTAMQDKKWVIGVLGLKVKALEELGQVKDALRFSQKINDLHREVARIDNEAELNKMKVSLGLQLQEQKNQLLIEQNRAQEDKIRNADVMRRVFYVMLGLAILVIALLLVALRQTLKAKKIREKGQRILENIEEGFRLVLA